MNIFYTDPCPVTSAQSLCDKHVVKMPLESAQMLCTAWRTKSHGDIWCDSKGLYKSVHLNHPSTKWARSNAKQYKWLFNHFVALCVEYTYRYGKIHKSFELASRLSVVPDRIINGTFTEPPMCMPDEYKSGNTITSYRNYIHGEKSYFAKWSKRQPPSWYVERGL